MKIIKLSMILLSCFCFNTHVLDAMGKGTPEEEVKKIERMARRSIEEKKSPWRAFLNTIFSKHEDSIPFANFETLSYTSNQEKN